MTRVYTAGPDGRCTVCQRPEAEHAPEAWRADPRDCPPAALAAMRFETDAATGDKTSPHPPTNTLSERREPAVCTPLLDMQRAMADGQVFDDKTGTVAPKRRKNAAEPTNTLRAMRLCERCGRPLVDHHGDGCPFSTAPPRPESDRDEAAHTLATAQAEIARFQALVVEWRAAHLNVVEARRSLDQAHPVSAWHTRQVYSAALARLDAAEIALAKSVPEVAS